MSEEEVNSRFTGAPMESSGRRAAQQPDSQARFLCALADLNSACARLHEIMNNSDARRKDARARMDMETQRMNNLLAKLKWEMCVVPARTAYLQSIQGAIRTAGLLNINGCNTPVPRCHSIAHPSRGTREHDALRVATGGPGAANFKKTGGRRLTVNQFAAWLTTKDMTDDGSRLGRIDGGSSVQGTPAASDSLKSS